MLTLATKITVVKQMVQLWNPLLHTWLQLSHSSGLVTVITKFNS
jgi:hypothetical protein